MFPEGTKPPIRGGGVGFFLKGAEKVAYFRKTSEIIIHHHDQFGKKLFPEGTKPPIRGGGVGFF